jgi:hypothetical protein
MMKAMKFSMPDETTLELCFNVDGSGVTQLASKAAKKAVDVELLKVTIEECWCVLCAPLWSHKPLHASRPCALCTRTLLASGHIGACEPESGPSIRTRMRCRIIELRHRHAVHSRSPSW